MSACVDKPLLKELVGRGIDGVDTAVLVIGNPDEELSRERAVAAQRPRTFVEIDGYFIEQELRFAVAAADRSAFDLEALDEGFDIVGRELRIEDQVKVDARPDLPFLFITTLFIRHSTTGRSVLALQLVPAPRGRAYCLRPQRRGRSGGAELPCSPATEK